MIFMADMINTLYFKVQFTLLRNRLAKQSTNLLLTNSQYSKVVDLFIYWVTLENKFQAGLEQE